MFVAVHAAYQFRQTMSWYSPRREHPAIIRHVSNRFRNRRFLSLTTFSIHTHTFHTFQYTHICHFNTHTHFTHFNTHTYFTHFNTHTHFTHFNTHTYHTFQYTHTFHTFQYTHIFHTFQYTHTFHTFQFNTVVNNPKPHHHFKVYSVKLFSG